MLTFAKNIYNHMKELIIIAVLIVLNGVFSMSEIALISARKAKLSNDAKKGSKSAKAALALSGEPDRFLSTVQIGITLIGIVTGIYSGDALALRMGNILIGWGLSQSIAYPLSQTLIVMIVTYLSIVLGELVPKRIGISKATSVAKAVAPAMQLLSKIAHPFVWILSQSTQLLTKILGVSEQENKVTEEEIKSIIQEGTEAGEVQEVEQDIMERVLVLGDQRVSSIMTLRKDLICMDIAMTPYQIKEVITQHLHEAYPVINGSIDQLCGMVSLKDLILTLPEKDFELSTVMKKALYFPESMTVYKALESFKQNKLHRALVCDEYGSLQGVITLHDILEGLVGSLEDAHDAPNIIARADKKSWLIDGSCPIYDFLEYFDCTELYNSETSYTSIGGLILNELEHIPSAGEFITWQSFRIEVVDMDGARIDKVMVVRTNEESHAEC